jgi:hypothetical protein
MRQISFTKMLKVEITRLGNAVVVGNHSHDVIEGKQRVALDLGEHVLPARAQRQQLDQLNVVPQRAAFVVPVPLGPHQLEKLVE